MEHYQYRFRVDDDAEYQASPEIRAAFALAERAHAGQKRYKIDPEIEYICHPIMVYDLLRHMGVTDTTLLASCFLHDAREMCEPYQSQPLSLQPALQAEIKQQGMGPMQAREAASDVAALVEQVTNHGARRESKAQMQMARARSMSHRAKILKIADQTASLICHQMMADDPKQFREGKAQDFATKAYSLVQAIVNDDAGSPTERAELNRWAALFLVVYASNEEVLRAQSPEKKQALRDDFPQRMHAMLIRAALPYAPRFPESIADTVRFTKRQLTSEEQRDMQEIEEALVEDGVKLPSNSAEVGGVLSVNLNKQGEVIGYATWAEVDRVETHFRNRLQKNLADALWKDAGATVEVRPLLQAFQLEGQVRQEARYHTIIPPVAAKDFIACAQKVQCMTPPNAEQLRRRSFTLAREDYLALPTSGAKR